MNVYLLTESECAALRAHNKNGAQVSPCDYGQGPCVELATLDLPEFSDHRAALDAIQPLSERTITEVLIDDAL